MTTANLLVEAVKRSDTAEVRNLLERDPDAALGRGADGASPIQEAAYRNAREVLGLLADRRPLDLFEAAVLGRLSRVADIVERDPARLRERSYDGWTALHLAAFFGHHDVAARLLEAGAELDARSTNYMANTPLHAAIAGAHDAPLIAMLIERGADVTAGASGGYTPLHSAASRGNVATIERLLAAGADAAARSDDGRTPAEIAAAHGHAEAAVRLGR